MENGPFFIRKAIAEDIERIAPLITKLCKEEGKSAANITVPNLMKLFIGKCPRIEVLLAEHDASVVGYLAFYGIASLFKCQPVMLVENMYVTPKCRTFGVGKLLLSAVAAETIDRGWDRLELNVRDDNEKARRFYERLGLESVHESVWRAERETLGLLANKRSGIIS